MKYVTLEYWNRDYTSPFSKVKNLKTICAESNIEIFEYFYKMNNSLRYCNGSYYKFVDKNWELLYEEWINSEDYKSKSFYLYYGNGVVD